MLRFVCKSSLFLSWHDMLYNSRMVWWYGSVYICGISCIFHCTCIFNRILPSSLYKLLSNDTDQNWCHLLQYLSIYCIFSFYNTCGRHIYLLQNRWWYQIPLEMIFREGCKTFYQNTQQLYKRRYQHKRDWKNLLVTDQLEVLQCTKPIIDKESIWTEEDEGMELSS